ncbi:glycosyltransferase [Blautia sp.]|uniref:glycosyltransferase n=1 Tax=Blautia sp. TaxID=1955243 RepID=UPI003A17ED17
MNGYYVFYGTTSSGVLKKIDMQVKELSKIATVKVIKVNVCKERNNIGKVLSRLPWEPLGFDYAKVKEELVDPDFIYIRRTTVDCGFIAFYNSIKKEYPKCKIVVEFYTYPYDKDDYNRNIKHFIINCPFYLKDIIYRKKYKSCVDRIITYSKDVSLFGIKTICTTNGVDVDEQKPVTNTNDGTTINLISVAQMQEHHGYERLISGLGKYYTAGGKRKIVYHAVGEGPELEHYKKLVKAYNLENNVVFYGKKFGNELDAIYDKADIAVASLGLYKYGIDVISTLKTCEYMAKGLPVISGCKISLLEDVNPPYICEIENNATPMDISKIIRFYDNLCDEVDQKAVTLRIRKFAKENMDMPVVMQPILKYLCD